MSNPDKSDLDPNAVRIERLLDFCDDRGLGAQAREAMNGYVGAFQTPESTEELVDRLKKLAMRRVQDGIYTDAMIVNRAIRLLMKHSMPGSDPDSD